MVILIIVYIPIIICAFTVITTFCMITVPFVWLILGEEATSNYLSWTEKLMIRMVL